VTDLIKKGTSKAKIAKRRMAPVGSNLLSKGQRPVRGILYRLSILTAA
jgi:hypothetical protein